MAVSMNDDTIYTARVPVTVMPITFYCMFRASTLNLTRQMMRLQGGGDQWYTMYHGSQTVRAYKRNGSTTPIIGTTGLFSADIWYAASITFQSHTNMRVYRDGANKATETAGCTPDGAQFTLFRFGDADFEGSLAELTVWDANFDDDDHAYLGQHIKGNTYRPDDLVFYASLLDDYYEEIGDETLLTTGDPFFSEHPPLFGAGDVYGPRIQVI